MIDRHYQFYEGKTHTAMRIVFTVAFGGFAVAAWLIPEDPCCIGGFMTLLFLGVLIGLSFNYITVIDLKQHQVRRLTTGFWGVPGNERVYDFEKFTAVEITSSEGDSPYSMRLRSGWKSYELKCIYGDFRPLLNEAEELAEGMGLPLKNTLRYDNET